MWFPLKLNIFLGCEQKNKYIGERNYYFKPNNNMITAKRNQLKQKYPRRFLLLTHLFQSIGFTSTLCDYNYMDNFEWTFITWMCYFVIRYMIAKIKLEVFSDSLAKSISQMD